MKWLLRLLRFFDARDSFCFVGFILLYVGIAMEFDPYIGMIVIGAIILIKGITHWV